jgi:hypothetical protein
MPLAIVAAVERPKRVGLTDTDGYPVVRNRPQMLRSAHQLMEGRLTVERVVHIFGL